MLVDLIDVTTPEGIVLSGAYFAPANVNRSPSVDAILFFHGDGGHFYSSLYLGLGRSMAEKGIAFLTANRRGHDHVAGGVRGGPLAGYAFESVDDSRADFGAWLELLRERGHRRIAIGGHSGGAVRATYAQATERFYNVAAVIAVSPGEYDHEGVIALHGENFSGPFRESERNIAEAPPGRLAPSGNSMGVNVERTGLRRLLQSGQSLQCDHTRGEHGLPYAICFRCRGERRWWATGDPGSRRSPARPGGGRLFARPG